MKFYLDNVQIPVVKCKRPSFNHHRGRTWDVSSFFVNDVKTKLRLDTTWGLYIYFQYGEDLQWYKTKMMSSPEEDLAGKGFHLDPFDNPKPNVVIK